MAHSFKSMKNTEKWDNAQSILGSKHEDFGRKTESNEDCY